jgi:hypothetical protein
MILLTCSPDHPGPTLLAASQLHRRLICPDDSSPVLPSILLCPLEPLLPCHLVDEWFPLSHTLVETMLSSNTSNGGDRETVSLYKECPRLSMVFYQVSHEVAIIAR